MTEQQPYELLQRYPHFELRRYPAHLVAEVEVTGSFDRAGNAAFRPLFNYISGTNTARRTVAMTAPVVQRSASTAGATSEKVAMTAPVVQRGPLPDGSSSGGASAPGVHVVAFVLPAGMTEDSAPIPADPRVHLRTVPASTAAVLRFSGSTSAPGFLRRNEVVQDVAEAPGGTAGGVPAP